MENGDEESFGSTPLRALEHKQEVRMRKWHSAAKEDTRSPYTRDQRIYKMLRGWYLRQMKLYRSSGAVLAVISVTLAMAFIVSVTTFPALFTLQVSDGTPLRCFISDYTTAPRDVVEHQGLSYSLPKIQLTLLARLDDGTPDLKRVQNTELFSSHSQAVEAGETYRNATFKCYRRTRDQSIIIGIPTYGLSETGVVFVVFTIVVGFLLVVSFIGLLVTGPKADRHTSDSQLKRQCERIGLIAPTYDFQYTEMDKNYENIGPWMPEPEEIQRSTATSPDV